MLELLTATTVDLSRSAARHGEGLFETIRIRDGVVLRLEAHLQRLAAGAAFLGLLPPPAVGAVRAFLEQALPALPASGVLRLLAVDGTLQVTVAAWEPARPGRILLGVSEGLRRYSQSPLNRFKTLSYLENRLLAREAERRGLFEVIALNEAGRLTDGGRTSLFLVRGQELLTPPVADGALPGVARRTLLETGLAREAPLTLLDLLEAPAVMLSNALQGAVAVHGLAENGNGPLEAGHWLLQRAREIL